RTHNLGQRSGPVNRRAAALRGGPRCHGRIRMTRALLASLEAHFHVDFTRVPERVAERFVALGPDQRTEQFLSEAERRRAGAVATRLHGWLGRFMSDFDVNG